MKLILQYRRFVLRDFERVCSEFRLVHRDGDLAFVEFELLRFRIERDFDAGELQFQIMRLGILFEDQPLCS